jgi:hypothetical protein
MSFIVGSPPALVVVKPDVAFDLEQAANPIIANAKKHKLTPNNFLFM